MAKYSGQSGQGLAEYITGGSIVAFVAIAAVAPLAANWQGFMAGIANDSVGGGNTIASANTSQNTPAPATQPVGVNAPIPGTTTNITTNAFGSTLTLSDGTTMTLEQYPLDVSMIETAGGHGTTEFLMSQMETIIAQLEIDGKIDQTQASLLKDLSNQGHRIAEMEKIYETTLANSGNDYQNLLNTPVTFDGVQYANADSMVRENLGWRGSHAQEIAATGNLLSSSFQIGG
ncbi:MAG: hypothetical protein KTR14_05720 [Vampirovibrio sp.]|nr:hypothetical protein [Vampirovibrio sp.]